MSNLEQQNQRVQGWFLNLRDEICRELERIEARYAQENQRAPQKFVRKEWERENYSDNQDGGGGTMSLLRGHVFEKAGVNISTVHGTFPPDFAREIPGAQDDPSFWASGISLVIHPTNPFVPIVHMNTRCIRTTQSWFGGGIDLTPIYPEPEDTKFFHQELKETCDHHDASYYPRFKAKCDDYFYIKHRKESRGVGGIFYDYLMNDNWEADFAFTQDIGKTFLTSYMPLVNRNYMKKWGACHKEDQKRKRGRYVEFNLLYDRGTRFGLMTNGNVEAILMSLPPEAGW